MAFFNGSTQRRFTAVKLRAPSSTVAVRTLLERQPFYIRTYVIDTSILIMLYIASGKAALFRGESVMVPGCQGKLKPSLPIMSCQGNGKTYSPKAPFSGDKFSWKGHVFGLAITSR